MNIIFLVISGHVGHPWNELADTLAGLAREGKLQGPQEAPRLGAWLEEACRDRLWASWLKLDSKEANALPPLEAGWASVSQPALALPLGDVIPPKLVTRNSAQSGKIKLAAIRAARAMPQATGTDLAKLISCAPVSSGTGLRAGTPAPPPSRNR